MRPASKYPTLELRIADSCTRVEHAIAIAALYRCLVRHLVRNPALNRDIGAAERAITLENKWIAQRHGIHGAFIDAASKTVRSVPELVEDMIAMLEPEAVALDCVGELASVRGIIQFGTSADHQIALETTRAAAASPARRRCPRSWTGWRWHRAGRRRPRRSRAIDRANRPSLDQGAALVP